jgi:hypothetical protein
MTFGQQPLHRVTLSTTTGVDLEEDPSLLKLSDEITDQMMICLQPGGRPGYT